MLKNYEDSHPVTVFCSSSCLMPFVTSRFGTIQKRLMGIYIPHCPSLFAISKNKMYVWHSRLLRMWRSISFWWRRLFTNMSWNQCMHLQKIRCSIFINCSVNNWVIYWNMTSSTFQNIHSQVKWLMVNIPKQSCHKCTSFFSKIFFGTKYEVSL